MRRTVLFLLTIISLYCSAQNWTESLNISNMEGMDNQPDLAVDQNGVFHCVWAHKIEENYWKIFYSKSTDQGSSWSVPEDISRNSEKWVAGPHIVCDSENLLHVSYDYEVGNPAETMIYYKIFDGMIWSEPTIVSENMHGSYQNQIAIDKNDRMYFFWYRSGLLGHSYYRYLENGIWSDITSPLNYYMVVVKVCSDSSNNLHCLAAHHGGQYYNNKYVYFNYTYASGLWSDTTEISKVTAVGADLDLDGNGFPHIAWYQKTTNSTSDNDSTMYRFYNGTAWSSPELIVEDPREQQIEIDENGKANIFDTEKYEDGSMLVHHFKKDNIWQGYIIDTSDYYGMSPKVENHNNKLLAVYVKPYLDNTNGEIFFSKSDVITNAYNNRQANILTLYPNPFHKDLHICFKTTNTEKVSVKVYSIQGKLMNTLLKEVKISGNNEVIWNGKDQNGNAVSPGIYLIRFEAGRYVITRSVILSHF